jgi:hypothetical protein
MDNWVQVIKCGGNRVVTLQITQLLIGEDVAELQCNLDYLRIYDGPNSSSPPLFISPCPTPVVSASSPLLLFSTTNNVYIRFTSDGDITGAGYTIQYACKAVVIVSSTSGTLYDTGGAGGQYGSNESVLTRITCPVGRGPQLTFTQLDIDGTLPSCSTDSLKIISGGGVKNTYCGTLTVPSLPQVSVGASSALILFTSDSTITSAGYSLDYECVLITSGKRFGFLFPYRMQGSN